MKRTHSKLYLAAAIATVLGASGAYAHKMPEPSHYDSAQQTTVDGALARSVAAALERAPAMGGASIRVEVDGSVAHLRGHIENEEQRRVAHEVAHSVPGIRDVVVTELQQDVATDVDTYAMDHDDRVVRDNVREALRHTRGIDASNVRIDVNDGIVYLEGTIPNQSQKLYAHDVAHDVPGVRSVRSDGLAVTG